MSAVDKDPFRGPRSGPNNVVRSTIVGGAAGAHTLTGITLRDRILKVTYRGFTLAEGAPNVPTFIATDLTSEFQGAALGITADDTIDNTGGTSTVNGWLDITWMDHDLGRTTDVSWNE